MIKKHLIKHLLAALLILLTSADTLHAQSYTPQTNPYYSGANNYVTDRIAEQNTQNNDPIFAPTYTPPPKQAPISQYQTPPKPHLPKPKTQPPSALEDMYARRVIDELKQFGYNMFGTAQNEGYPTNPNSINTAPPMGAVQDNFILSTGDELNITFTGQRNDRATYRIETNGNILIRDFPPIPATGRSIGELRDTIQSAANNLYNTRAFVSLASVRQIGVLVIGHVQHPGRKNMTAFNTILDALTQSGGIEKTGSLRQIKLVRQGRSHIIDLYTLLIHGTSNIDLTLQDGDRLIIPPIGPTVAVSGEVKRPGIFELRTAMQGMLHRPDRKARNISLNDMLQLSGGTLSPGKNRFMQLSISPSGSEKVAEIFEPFTPIFGDGAVLMVSKGEEKRSGTIELVGHTRRPGLHSGAENKSLRDLISSENVLGPDIYPLIGVIKRWNSLQLAYELQDFPLKLVLDGDYDEPLQDSDIIHLFSNTQIRNLFAPDLQARLQNISYGSNDEEENTALITDADLRSFLTERSVFVRGAIRSEGSYPIAEGATLDSVIAVSGGLSLEADTANIEITSSDENNKTTRQTIDKALTNLANIPVSYGDSIRINQRFKKITNNSVIITGEINNSGSYDLVPGDKLSDLLKRAGGLTAQAYPDGAIFSRANERRAEKARFKSQARTIRQSIAAALKAEDKKINTDQIAEARALASELENAKGLGRITVTAIPELLSTKPELDMLLEPGDRLHIPKRTLTVRVDGQVLSPAALQFREDKEPLDYIREAGGFTFHADKNRTFVLYPDGSAQPLKVSNWNYNAAFIPPGSTIIVPQDPKPFDFISTAKDVSQILSNLAITAIFVDDVSDD